MKIKKTIIKHGDKYYDGSFELTLSEVLKKIRKENAKVTTTNNSNVPKDITYDLLDQSAARWLMSF